jgi:regulator of extracellular matrix RemA (YlzA/DUF370 family)
MRITLDIDLDTGVPKPKHRVVKASRYDAVVIQGADCRRVQEPIVEDAQHVVRVGVKDEEVARRCCARNEVSIREDAD